MTIEENISLHEQDAINERGTGPRSTGDLDVANYLEERAYQLRMYGEIPKHCEWGDCWPHGLSVCKHVSYEFEGKHVSLSFPDRHNS